MHIIVAIFLIVAAWFTVASLGAALLLVGWNYGVLAAFPAHGLGHLGFWQAFFLAMALSAVAGAMRRARRSRRGG
jgi:hypothetical protein